MKRPQQTTVTNFKTLCEQVCFLNDTKKELNITEVRAILSTLKVVLDEQPKATLKVLLK